MLDGVIDILSLDDIGCHTDIPETADTLEGNALMKAGYVASHYGLDCFADDSGLEVEALGGAPGVHSARYATDGHDHRANIAKLLVDEYILGREIPYQEAYGDVLYTCVPARVIKTSVPDPELRRRVLSMYRAGKADYPYNWKGDTLAHKLWSTITYFHQIEKFKRYVGDVRREKAH